MRKMQPHSRQRTMSSKYCASRRRMWSNPCSSQNLLKTATKYLLAPLGGMNAWWPLTSRASVVFCGDVGTKVWGREIHVLARWTKPCDVHTCATAPYVDMKNLQSSSHRNSFDSNSFAPKTLDKGSAAVTWNAASEARCKRKPPMVSTSL
jgi:hypothetical protein